MQCWPSSALLSPTKMIRSGRCWPVSLSRKPRSSTLDLLRRTMESTLEGRGGFVAIVGEAGLGKSRLIAELRSIATSMNPRVKWMEGRAISYGQTVPYYPWRQMLREASGAHDDTLPEETRVILRH